MPRPENEPFIINLSGRHTRWPSEITELRGYCSSWKQQQRTGAGIIADGTRTRR